jgi:membrane-bound ClpP family serine protease
MPLAVLLLSNPAGAYGCFVTTLAAFVYACHTRAFVPMFTAVAAALLTGIAFAYTPPNGADLALLIAGTALLQAEFLLPTYGAALLTGLAASGAGSWLLLGATPAARDALTGAPRMVLATLGTLLLLAAVLRGLRLRMLTAHS